MFNRHILSEKSSTKNFLMYLGVMQLNPAFFEPQSFAKEDAEFRKDMF